MPRKKTPEQIAFSQQVERRESVTGVMRPTRYAQHRENGHRSTFGTGRSHTEHSVRIEDDVFQYAVAHCGSTTPRRFINDTLRQLFAI